MKAAIPWNNEAGQVPQLAPGDCHVWELQPSQAYADNLGAGEMARYQAISNAQAKINFATSQGGLRSIAARYQNCEPWQIRLEHEERGKPYLAGGPHFNLSHTAGRIFAAFSLQPLGLDIESANRRVRARELAARFFSGQESAHIQTLDDEQARAVFLRYWVCKEATVKLSGDGIYLGLSDARVELCGAGLSRGNYLGREVCLREFAPGENLLAALASWEPVEAKGFFRI